MNPSPRIRKTVKWGGVVVCAVLVVVWVVSVWWFVAWGETDSWRGISRGRLLFSWNHSGFTTGSRIPYWSAWRNAPETRWRFEWGNDGSSQYWFRVPLWALLVLTILPTATAWRLDTRARRRARLNLCPKCNYDRRGLPAASPCPECGAVAGFLFADGDIN